MSDTTSNTMTTSNTSDTASEAEWGQDSLSIVVPTLGHSLLLMECLIALRQDASLGTQIILVCQGEPPPPKVERWVDLVLWLESPLGFAAANNLALRYCRGRWVALVNDDVLIDDGWCQALLAALAARPNAAAVQGVQRQMSDVTRLDGWGIGWNRHWQAVQLGHGEDVSQAPTAAQEIFGVSATAAIYRHSALRHVASSYGEVFDHRLFAYYEDVLLAGRLRAAGLEAWVVPEATARHAASTSGRRLPGAGLPWIYGNRHLALMDLLGRRYVSQWPRILGRDLADAYRYGKEGAWSSVAAIVKGWGRVLRHGLRFCRPGAPRASRQQLSGFRVDA